MKKGKIVVLHTTSLAWREKTNKIVVRCTTYHQITRGKTEQLPYNSSSPPNLNPVTCSQFPEKEIRNQKSANHNQKPETRNQKPKTKAENKKPKTKNRKQKLKTKTKTKD
ncbi:hypothetical protein [Paenibacillus sp. Root444D2]|uniref:hypothetical protein n=1 Tax=Paenibacillus sp. Root444D2 TaxID=1736538 RepID=UPI00070BC7E5|nr:hypothetical protein [Paenibacillus sp. Root444D2]KQX61461.1 hypothetical protein ASD40_30135 [Paenibacillus sp. Root444D2]